MHSGSSCSAWFEGLEASYVFDVTADPGHASRGELLELLEETAACSAKIGCRITDGRDWSSGFCATRRTPASTSGRCHGHEFSR